MASSTPQAGTSFSRLIGTGIGTVFLIFNIWSFLQAYLLKHSGLAVQGTVVRPFTIKRKGSISYNADYTYEVMGMERQGTADVTRETYLALRPGGPIAIRYVPSTPNLSEAWEAPHSSTTMFLTVGLGIPISLWILVLALRKPPGSSKMSFETSGEFIGERNIALPNTVKGVAFTMYPVTDMKRARKFYEEDLGLKYSEDYGGNWVEYHLWDTCFAITTKAGDGLKPSAEAGGTIAFEVQDVDDFVSQLRKKGIQIKVEPFSTRVCRMAVVLDPEGNALTLHSRST